ncbi:sulfatase [Roseateles sp. BYS87W]|uniref:Sulfatase n=1 Tax=Pelomonas baiyunensis TaxID=3299026 RepID=A0ABW7H3V4_9BURK
MPSLTFWRCFSTTHAALAVLWMPWALLKQVDAFLGFLRPTALLHDLALALLVLTLPAALLASLGLTVCGVLKRLGASNAAAQHGGWAIALTPVAWVCVWQFGSASWAWLRAVTQTSLALNAPMRVIFAAVLIGIAVVGLRGGRWRTALGATVRTLMGLTGPTAVALVLAVLWVAVAPPRLLRPAPVVPVDTAADARTEQPDVFLITIDTLAAIDANVCGTSPTLMPRLRELAQQASCFDRAYSSANFTTPGTATLETGALPWTHWGVQIVAKMAPDVQPHTLAQTLRTHGWEAHAISANLMASPRHHGSFGGYDSDTVSPSPSWGLKPRLALTALPDTTLPFWLSGLVPFLDTLDVYRFAEHSPFPAELSYAAALERLASTRKPTFLWVHTLPPHDPYLATPEFKYRLLPAGELDRWAQMRGMGPFTPSEQPLIDKHRLRYRESIMAADAALGRFLDQLRQQGRLDRALVVVSSDHGESFAHGMMGHAGDVMNEGVLRVPLVIKRPGQQQGQRIQAPVSLADVVPTLADLLSLPVPAHADGHSLKPALLGQDWTPAPVYAMAMERQSRFQRLASGQYVVVDGAFKLVLDLARDRATLYRLDTDPDELHDLSASDPATTARLRGLLTQQLAAAEQRRTRLFDTP